MIAVCSFVPFPNNDTTTATVRCEALICAVFWKFCARSVCLSAWVLERFSQRCVLHCAVRIQHRNVWVSTVCWTNAASCEYSLLGEYCMLWVQSVGQIQQAMSTVCWANTARCEYSVLRKYCKMWVQSVGKILRTVCTVCWTNTAGCEYSLLGKYCKMCVQSVGQILQLCHHFTLRGIPTIIWILDFQCQLVYRLQYYLGYDAV